MIKKPKFDGKIDRSDFLGLHDDSLVARLMEMHGESYASVTVDDKGQRVERVDGYEPPVQSSV